MAVCNVNSNTVSIIDSSTYTITSNIIGVTNPFGIAFDPVAANNRFLVCGFGGIVYSIDATNLAITNSVTGFGNQTIGITFDISEQNNRFLVCSSQSGVIAIGDSGTLALTGTLSSFTNPRFIAFDPILANNRFLVSDFGANEIVLVNQVSS
jgi:YVTN family beta-propeller protein